MIYRPWTALALATLLSACASVPKVYETAVSQNPSYSRAMNVLIAAGYVTDPKKSPIRDVSRADVAQSAKSPDTTVVDAGYAITNLLSPPAGVGFGFALGMSAMSLLLPSPTEPLAHSMVFAWMPKPLAATPADAKATMQALIDKALDGALAEVLHPPYHPVPRNPKQPGRVVITGGECLSKGARCAYWPMVYYEPVAAVAPGILGGAPVWTWTHIDRPSELIVAGLRYSGRDTTNWSNPYRAWLPDLAVFKAMSSRLPEWVFLYLAPRTISLGDGKFLQIPLVLNQGEPLYFVSPGA